MGRQLILLVFLALLVGCDERVDVLPEKAAPGETIFIRHTGANFKDKGDITVRIGQRRSGVVAVHDPHTIEVLVPDLDPGKAKLTVEAGQFRGSGTFGVRRTSKRRLFLTYDSGKIVPGEVFPYTGHYSEMPERGRRLSYDVLDEKGRVVYTGAIRHPEEWSIEAFPGDGRIHRVPVRGPLTFAVKLPAIEGPTRVQFFDVPDGTDLKSFPDRAERRPITEITIQDR